MSASTFRALHQIAPPVTRSSCPRRGRSRRTWTTRRTRPFREKFGPRGVLHTWASPDGTQCIEDTGPLTKKRMETCDEEFRDAAIDFIKRQHEAETPFFVWFSSTHMHFRTHPKPESVGRSGRWQSEYHDPLQDHDDIVMYSTGNGPHMNSWPDAGMNQPHCSTTSR
jgi:hypothetical protein